MELGKFDPFNPPKPEDIDSAEMDFLDIEDKAAADDPGCCPDRSRSAVRLPADCDRIPDQIRYIRPTDDPYDSSE